jgi:hypothetical protein
LEGGEGMSMHIKRPEFNTSTEWRLQVPKTHRKIPKGMWQLGHPMKKLQDDVMLRLKQATIK